MAQSVASIHPKKHFTEEEEILKVKSHCLKDQSKVYKAKGVRYGEKVVVTQEGIDDWRAQQFGIKLDNFPTVRPAIMDPDVFDELKEKYGMLNRINYKKIDEEDQPKIQSKYKVQA